LGLEAKPKRNSDSTHIKKTFLIEQKWILEIAGENKAQTLLPKNRYLIIERFCFYNLLK
jgi:hypothetical protein